MGKGADERESKQWSKTVDGNAHHTVGEGDGKGAVDRDWANERVREWMSE